LESRTGAPGFWDRPQEARDLLARVTTIRNVLTPFRSVETALQDTEVLLELGGAEDPGPQQDAVWRDAASALDRADALLGDLELQALLGGRFDASNAYLSLHAGAGGTESCDWADMLFRMYMRYCEVHGFETSVLSYQPGEEAGIRSVAFSVTGPYAYGYLKSERGVHRLVRISPFDANKRRHTSFAAMDVVAEVPDDIEVDIQESDLRVDTYRSSGSGGQHINKTDSAIRITHGPTGIVVSCQAERSQHKNRAKAMQLLRAQLYEYYQDQKRKEMERFYAKKGEIAWGSQIRSYVLQPYTMVKDHRTAEETGNVDAVLDGSLQRFITAYLKWQARQARDSQGG